MRTPKDPITAFRGAGRGRYAVVKLVNDRRVERREEDTRDRSIRNPADILSSDCHSQYFRRPAE